MFFCDASVPLCCVWYAFLRNRVSLVSIIYVVRLDIGENDMNGSFLAFFKTPFCTKFCVARITVLHSKPFFMQPIDWHSAKDHLNLWITCVSAYTECLDIVIGTVACSPPTRTVYRWHLQKHTSPDSQQYSYLLAIISTCTCLKRQLLPPT